MNQNEFKGTVQDVTGRAEEGLGDLTGDAKLKVDGKIDQVSGNGQAKFGGALEEVRDRVAEGAKELSQQASAVAQAAVETRESAKKIMEGLSELAARVVRERPILSIAGAVAAGMLASSILAPSRKGQQR